MSCFQEFRIAPNADKYKCVRQLRYLLSANITSVDQKKAYYLLCVESDFTSSQI